jgi:hypothetical protein
MGFSLAFRIAVGVQLSVASYIKRNMCVPNATLRGYVYQNAYLKIYTLEELAGLEVGFSREPYG